MTILLYTLGVVGVERGTSETTRRISNGEKVGTGAFATLKRRGPQGEPTFGLCVFAKSPKEANGEDRSFGYCSFVE